MKGFFMRTLLLCLVLASAVSAQNAVLVGSYFFQNTFNSQRPGSLPLTPVNPSGSNSFVTDTVFGQQRVVYDVRGAASPDSAQGGLTWQGKGRVPVDNYSMEIICAVSGSGWRRILDLQNRQISEGLYFDPTGYINYYSGLGGIFAGAVPANTYAHIVLVKRGTFIAIYLNGKLADSRNDATDFGTIKARYNPDQLVHLFLDDNSTAEWAPSRVALFRAYSGALTEAEIKELAATPFTSVIGIPKPGFQSSGIVNSASYSSANAISPGSFFSIFGTDLADNTGDWGQAFTGNTAPRRLNNVRVLINDQEAFVVFTSPGQVNALAPDNIPDGPVTVVVENGPQLRSAVVPSTARRINPAVFRFNAENSRYLASTANDGSAYIAPANLFGTGGSLNGLAIRPARPGEFIVLYATGTGPTTPAVPAGQIPAARNGGYPLANTSEVRLTGNGQTVTVRPAYAGLSGFPGLIQIVFEVPNISTGDYETTIVVNGQSSPTGAFLPIAR
jgi:uncharacterized protein (TIGR03437 family)